MSIFFVIKSDLPEMSLERVEEYRIKAGKTWDQVASDIGLSRSMLMMIKSGKRNLSAKALYRLEQAEISAGIRPSPSVRENPAEYGRSLIAEMRDGLRDILSDLEKIKKRALDMQKKIGRF